MGHLLFNIAYVFYTGSTLLYLLYLLTKKESHARSAYACLAVGLALHAGSLVTQASATWLAGRQLAAPMGVNPGVPWSNWFESLSFFAAVIAVIFFAIQWRAPLPVLGVFIMPINWLLTTYALFKERCASPLLPSIQNDWIAIHIPVMFTAYSLLGVAFAVGIAYLLQEYQLKSKCPGDLSYRLPPLEQLDTLIYKLIRLAFPLLTIGIILGGLWAYHAWGRFWSWDPKETWTLITWCIYLIYLALRWFGGWRGRKTAYLSLVGFALVLFTYAGVNYLSPLHGFLSTPP